VAVKIKLMRLGKIRQPYYRIVVADARARRSGRAIETIGKYHPKEDPSFIEVKSDRAQHWLSVGAQPTEAVAAILKVTGDWQKFKGEPGAEGTLRAPSPKRDKAEIFNEALKDSKAEPTTEAVTKKASKKAESKPEAKADEKAEQAPAPVPAVETPEGATEEAEAAEVKAHDADNAEEKAGGEVPADKAGAQVDNPSSDTGAENEA